MKNAALILIGIFVLVSFYNPMAETKVGHVDSEYVFQKIPAYADAQAELEDLAAQYKSEVEAKYKVVDSLYSVYQKEEVLLPQETKVKKQNEIITKENEAKALQQSYFGRDGMLDQKREEVLKPIQDNVYNSLKELAEAGSYDYIFDKSTGELLYTNDARDQSDALLKKLGY
ncbi:MAG: OmpH family outer membrane protein [Bacteroidales bacterium]|nr:OmpH family outer membrane protein [Bacteroidales bacterium]